MNSENEIIVMGHDAEYGGKYEFQDMVVEEYDEELNGEVQANNNQAYNPNLWPVAATKMLIAIKGPMSAEFEKIKKKGSKNCTLAKNCQHNDK
ncbi:unnamed protein product [Macrosiphum euphorbiae]|uniref:Uncharacterized protein n=1 Tax=Macrosiphum euphorbiae TaxID=13131 RepID=A0AAV0XMG2_9HEMI|nr:unnamed protein product [Macrosiphum euphorbiae]